MYSFPLKDDEVIIKKSHASFHVDGEAWSGAFYLTDRRVVFVGYMMDINKKFLGDIPLSQVSEVKGEKTFHIIPNVIHITARNGYRCKVIVEGRNAWLTAIQEELAKQG
ncbi:MAG: GRAM domain-containing protein [Negativicutes bacterium]|nr:GRAM domain-containing protein [Negativicutes bacterium]